MFVDDEESILQGLRVMLHPMRAMWDMSFIQSGEEALNLIDNGPPYDVVIADLHMPGMHGDELLKEVKARSPQVVRFVLSGNLESETLIKVSTFAHQVLSKPCDPNELRTLVSRALSLREHLWGSHLSDTLLKMGTLPSIPVLYQEITTEMQGDDPSIAKIGEIIEKDPAMSVKVLQIVNSAASGLRHAVSNVVQATALLGMDNIRKFVLLAEVFSTADEEALPKGMTLEGLWQHAITVGQYAKRIAEEECEDRDVIDDSYTAGLLHDVGLMILATKLPEQFNKALVTAREQHMSLFDAEKETLGATHAEIGGHLLELWGIPDSIVEAITYHVFPSANPEQEYGGLAETGFTPLTAVHIANYLCEGETASGDEDIKCELDSVYLDRLGIADHVELWWDICVAANM
jgi:HD-like signal output (HDOD) protein/CheY-like chemotaxis protein